MRHLPPLAAVLLLGACSSEPIAVGVPALAVPTDVFLGDVAIGARSAIVVPLENIGTAEAVATAAVVEGPFDLPAEFELVIAPGDIGELVVLFQPEDYADLVGTVLVSEGPTDFIVALQVSVDPDGDSDGHDATGAGGDDCDDEDQEIHGGQAEVCDGRDTDCNGIVDDVDDPPSWWPDLDGDTWGDDDAPPVLQCAAPPQHTDRPGDCDDTEAGTRPDAVEVLYDGVDADCDGASDYDQDLDGFDCADVVPSCPGTDCDDTDPLINPDAVEVWYDGIDADCDGASDFDRDLDGFDCAAGAPGCVGTDCDDGEPLINPGAVEVWYDGVDDDCDGNDDDQDYDLVPLGPDCDDQDPSINPNAPELDDGVDQDCDQLIDEDFLGPGSLVITEFMAIPQAVPVQRGRYVEVANPTDGHVDLSSLLFEMGPASVPLPLGYLEPQGVLLLCLEPDPLLNGGLICDGDLVWFNPTRVLQITTAGALVIDGVDFTSWTTVPAGASLELALDRIDAVANDLEASWCPAQVDLGSGDLGTPGIIAPPCP